MAKVELDPAIKSIRKRMGSLVFRKLPTGETTMIKRADMSNVEWSPAQIENRQRMKQANSYAKKAMASPKVRAIYEKMAKKQHKHPYHVAVSDYYKGNDLLSRK